jgi:hypothetical protein
VRPLSKSIHSRLLRVFFKLCLRPQLNSQPLHTTSTHPQSSPRYLEWALLQTSGYLRPSKVNQLLSLLDSIDPTSPLHLLRPPRASEHNGSVHVAVLHFYNGNFPLMKVMLPIWRPLIGSCLHHCLPLDPTHCPVIPFTTLTATSTSTAQSSHICLWYTSFQLTI